MMMNPNPANLKIQSNGNFLKAGFECGRASLAAGCRCYYLVFVTYNFGSTPRSRGKRHHPLRKYPGRCRR